MKKILFILLFTLNATLSFSQAIVPKDYDLNILAQAIFEATNELRVELGYSSFKSSKDLFEAAQFQADRMAKRKRLQHDWRGDKKYGTARARITQFGANFRATGENIARDYLVDIPSGQTYYLNEAGQAITRQGKPIPYRSYQQIARKVVKDWYNSPGHRENLLRDFEYLGIGASKLVPEKKGPNFDVYLVQNFGK